MSAARSRRCCVLETERGTHRGTQQRCLRLSCNDLGCRPCSCKSLQVLMNRSLSQQQPEFSEVRNCVSGFSRELAVPPSKLVLLFDAAFCRRDQSLSHWRETRFLERAMGIEPTSEAWRVAHTSGFTCGAFDFAFF